MFPPIGPGDTLPICGTGLTGRYLLRNLTRSGTWLPCSPATPGLTRPRMR